MCTVNKLSDVHLQHLPRNNLFHSKKLDNQLLKFRKNMQTDKKYLRNYTLLLEEK